MEKNTIRTEKPEDLSFLYAERDPVNRGQVAKLLGQVLCLDQTANIFLGIFLATLGIVSWNPIRNIYSYC